MILARKIKKSKDFLQIFGMWKHFLDILWNSDKIWWSCSANRRENCKILTMLFEILWKNAKIRDENFLKYWGLSGAKACKSCRSRRELSNEYFLAKIGFDTEENEPCKVCPLSAHRSPRFLMRRERMFEFGMHGSCRAVKYSPYFRGRNFFVGTAENSRNPAVKNWLF